MARTLGAALTNELFVTDHVHRFRVAHRLGLPAEAYVDAFVDSELELDQVVGTEAHLCFGYEDGIDTCFSGIVESAAIIGTSSVGLVDSRAHLWPCRFHIVSRLYLLSRSFGCDIFQELDVKGIIQKVLENHGIESDKVEWRLSGTYPKLDYCVRYQESALAFICRLAERDGIYFFSESVPEEGERIIFADDSTAAKPIEGEASVVYRPRSQLHDAIDAIYSISRRHQVHTGKYVLRDFNFENPNLDLTATAAADVDMDLEVYDYPSKCEDKSVGTHLATMRLQADSVRRKTLAIEADCTRIAPGRAITMVDAEDDDGDYVISAVTHEFLRAIRKTLGETDETSDLYTAHAKLLPASVPFRSPCRTPVPILAGPQTATVVAPEGSQSEEVHTDKHARCKLRFHWDLAGITDDKASYWFRVAQQQTSGSLMLPRVDWEVVVEYLEGDPDRPIVTGRLDNGRFMPTYALPEGKTRTAVQTASSPGGGGSNEIRYEDKAGAEEIMMHSQYDTTIAVANNKTKNVGNNETSVVGVNSSLKVGANQDTKITKGNENTVGADQSITVGGNRSVEANSVLALNVSGSSTTVVGGNQFEMSGNPLQAVIALAVDRAVEFASARAGDAIAQVQGAVQGAVDQALGPVQGLTQQADALGQQMQALGNGDLSAAGGLIAGATGLPGVGAVGSAMAGGPGGGEGGGLAATRAAPGADASAGGIAATNAISAAATSAVQGGLARAGALAREAAGGGGGSQGNVAGPEGDVDGVDASDRTKGPGHGTNKVDGSHTETVGGLKATAALTGINTNVAGTMSVSVGAAAMDLVLGNRAESVEGAKSEQSVGLVVVTKGDESEQVGGAKTTTVGGAIIDLIKGNHSVEAGAPATFIGAFHKIQAKSKITFKCGSSEVVIDGGGVTFTAPVVTFTGAKVQLAKAVSEG